MNVNVMRAIDYWVGIPLVFLLTIVYRVRRFIGLAPRRLVLASSSEISFTPGSNLGGDGLAG